jgi:hypothetical protein
MYVLRHGIGRCSVAVLIWILSAWMVLRWLSTAFALRGRVQQSCFPAGCADSAADDGRRGSNVYEVNTWLWQFGRGKPRLGGLTIEETSDRQDAARKASDKRRKETREGHKGDGS